MMHVARNNSILRLADGVIDRQTDELAHEEPLEIRVRGRAVSVTMRTPGHDAELAVGFLLSEGMIHTSDDIVRIEPCSRVDANVVNVVLAPDVPVDFDRLTRHVFASSSCGLCGKATIEAIQSQCEPIDTDMRIDVKTLLSLPDQMRASQASFNRTGGLHASAIFDAQGKLLVIREDVGRHNAVDKVIGHALLHRPLPLDQHVLLVSGRSSFEIVQKALAARIPLVASISAASSLAVEFADSANQTLIGFLRQQRFNVYSHPQRIRFEPAS